MTQPSVPYLLNSVDLSCYLKQVKQTFSDLENNLTLYDSNDFKNHTNQKEYYIYLFNKLVECEYLNLRLCRLYQSQYLPQKNETYLQTSLLKSTIQVRETTTSVNSDSLSTDTMKAEWTSDSVSYKNDMENLKDIEIFNKEFHNLWKKLKCFREQLGKHINLLEKDSILTPFQLEKLLHRIRRMHLINVEWLVQLNLQHLSKYDNLILFMKYVMELTHTSTPEDCINALSKLFKPSLQKPFKLFQSQTTTVCPSLKMTHKWTKVTTLANISQASTQSLKNNETIQPIMDSKHKSSEFIGSEDTSRHRSELNNNNDTNVNPIEMEHLCVTHKKSDCSSSEEAFSTESTTQKSTCFTVPACHKSDHFQSVDKTVLSRENIHATESVLSCTKFHQLTFTEMLSFQHNDSMALQVDIKKNACSTKNCQCTPLCKVSKSITDCDTAFHKHIHEDISSTISEECIIQHKSDISNSRNHNMNTRTNKTLDHFNDDISKPSFVTSSSITNTNESTSSLLTKKNETQILWTRNLKNMNDEEQDIFKDLMKSQTVWEKKLSFNKKDCDFHSNWMKTALLQSFTNDECAFPKLPRTLTKSCNKNNTLRHSQQLKTSMSNNTQEMRSNHTGKLRDTRMTNVKDPSNFSSDNKNQNIHLSLKNTHDYPNTGLTHSVITNKQYRKHNHSACQKTIHNYRLMYRSLIDETYDQCLNENMKLFSLWIGLSLKREYDILPFSTSTMKKPMTFEILEAYVASNLLFSQPLSSTIPSCRLWKIFDSFFL